MALKAILEKLEDAPEATRSFYRESEGKFILDVEPANGYALEDVSGLKSALGKERTSREALEKQVVKFKDIDPEKALAALKELEELKAIDPTKEADKIASTKFEAAKSQLLEKHTAELKVRDERVGHLSGTIDSLLREQRAAVALAEAKGSVELLLPHVLKSTRTVERDGRFDVEVVDAEGNVRIDGKGNNMSIKDLVAEMRQSESFGAAFQASGKSGSDKPGGSASGKPTAGNFGGSKEDRVAAIRSRFPDLE